MASPVLELDLTDKKNPPPDDLARAPHGWTWDRAGKAWRPKKSRSRGGWTSRNAKADFTAPSPPADDMEPFERDVAGDDPPPAYANVRPPKVPKTPPKVTAKTRSDSVMA